MDQSSSLVSRQLEGLESDLPGMIKRIVAQANSQTIETTIRRLRIEETALKPRDGGTSADSYGGGEAEKTIQSLIDALETARLTQREKEERAEAAERLLGERAGRMSISQDGGSRPPRTAQPSMFPSGRQQLQAYDASIRSSKTTNSGTNSETSFSYQSTPMQSPGGLNVIAPPNGFLHPSSTHDPPAFPQSHHHFPYRDDKKPLDDANAESILFKPIDPISKTELLDPILASDGFIHDRFCFLSARPSYPSKPNTPLTILGNVTQLRLAIHARFPERKDECLARRSSYLLEAVRLADTGFFSSDSADALEQLTGVLEWQGEDADTGVLVRRAILRWRVRHLAGALEDLEKALRLAPALPVRHWLAMVLVDMRRWSEAEEAISSALARDANAPLPLSLRSIIHSQHGRTSEAYRDVELASTILASPPPNYTNEPQTSTDSKSTYSTLSNAAPSTSLPTLLDLNHLATGHAWLALAEPVRASVPLARAIELGPAGEAWTRALWGVGPFILFSSSFGFPSRAWLLLETVD
jgi:tetratricopeptide (TPR) repeat protein